MFVRFDKICEVDLQAKFARFIKFARFVRFARFAVCSEKRYIWGGGYYFTLKGTVNKLAIKNLC